MNSPVFAVTSPQRSPLAPSIATAALLGALVVSADADDGIVLCPFRRCTGGYCPGCGATRATNRLLRGDVAASWAHHPWIILAAAQLAVLLGIAAVLHPAERLGRLRRMALPLLIANCALLIGIWVLRLHADTIPTGWL